VQASGYLAYVQNAALFTPAERSFYTVLLLSLDEGTTIFGKVRVADVLSASKTLDTKLKRSATNKILSKHFDFVLVDSKTLEIKCAIELDDSSHNSKKRQMRDAFLESACRSAELRLVRFKAKRAYKKTEIVQALGFAGQPAKPIEKLPVVPLDFLSKLAALVPRPRHNLVRYHGVLARGCHQPNAKIRKLIVPKNNKRLVKKVEKKEDEEAASRDELAAPLTWAQRRDGEPLKRVFNMMGPPTDYPMPFVWRSYARHRTGPPSDH
jgi:very-short-patch-repair endonuclease